MLSMRIAQSESHRDVRAVDMRREDGAIREGWHSCYVLEEAARV